MVLKLNRIKPLHPAILDMFIWGSLIAFYASMSIATISFEQSGWLDRVVQYHKNNFLNDLETLPRVEIKASIEPAPYGYEDPDTWDLDSVLRLLGLLQYNEAAPIFQYLRRSMPGRRFMKYADTFKAFPSLAKNHPNYFYYDAFSDEYDSNATPGIFKNINDDSIIVVSNPAEARLPAAQISVRLLKEILEARAIAARYMPSSVATIYWKPMNKTNNAIGGGATTGGGAIATTVAGAAGAAGAAGVTGAASVASGNPATTGKATTLAPTTVKKR